MSVEAVLAAGYAGALVLGAFLMEWLSAHTHRRSLRYRTAGFTYQPDHDLWICPEGEHLWPKEFDRERRLVRYRAKGAVCNACPRKDDCTDSANGREIVRPLDAWPHSEAGRFHRVLSLLMVVLAVLIAGVAAVRNTAPAELATLLVVLGGAAGAAHWLLRDLRRHPANFPAPTASHGLGLAMSPRDGSSEPKRWASG
jgi:hypothetical protein